MDNPFKRSTKSDDSTSHVDPKTKFRTIIMSREAVCVFSAVATKPLGEFIVNAQVNTWPEGA